MANATQKAQKTPHVVQKPLLATPKKRALKRAVKERKRDNP
jgi:hypothetical protein